MIGRIRRSCLKLAGPLASVPRSATSLLVALIVAASATLCFGLSQAGSEAGPEIRFTADPAKAIIHAKLGAGRQRVLYTLFGDGRFLVVRERTSIDTRDDQVRRTRHANRFKAQCSFQEVNGLLESLARSGVLEMTSGDVDRIIQKRLGSRRFSTDISDLVVEFNLEHYAYRGIRAVPFHTTLRVPYFGPEVIERVFPDVEQFRGTDFLYGELERLSKLAEALPEGSED